jgi:hypothetical protein
MEYLHGLKAWNTFHNTPYPPSTETRVKLMLKASGQEDARLPPKPGKAPVLIADLLQLYHFLSGKGPKVETVKDLAIVAFWGMARLAEVTYQAKTGPIPRNLKLTRADVVELHYQKICFNCHQLTCRLIPSYYPLYFKVNPKQLFRHSHCAQSTVTVH